MLHFQLIHKRFVWFIRQLSHRQGLIRLFLLSTYASRAAYAAQCICTLDDVCFMNVISQSLPPKMHTIRAIVFHKRSFDQLIFLHRHLPQRENARCTQVLTYCKSNVSIPGQCSEISYFQRTRFEQPRAYRAVYKRARSILTSDSESRDAKPTSHNFWRGLQRVF